MGIQTFFLYLLAILLTARIFAELASRLQTPPVIGAILAGLTGLQLDLFWGTAFDDIY